MLGAGQYCELCLEYIDKLQIDLYFINPKQTQKNPQKTPRTGEQGKKLQKLNKLDLRRQEA